MGLAGRLVAIEQDLGPSCVASTRHGFANGIMPSLMCMVCLTRATSFW